MVKVFIVKTKNGSVYEVQDHRHLISDDEWILIRKGGRNYVLGLLQVMKPTKELKILDFFHRRIIFGRTRSTKPESAKGTSQVVEIYQKIA